MALNNYIDNSPEKYYKQSNYVPYLDEILSSLTESFTLNKSEIITLIKVISY